MEPKPSVKLTWEKGQTQQLFYSWFNNQILFLHKTK